MDGRYEHRVQYYETDRMGITHHSNYIRWMEEARVAFLDGTGWDLARLESLGIVSPVVSVECRYKQTTTFPETIRIAVSVEGFNGVRLKLKYEMENAAGKLVCEGRSEHCFLNAAGRPVHLKRDFPDFYRVLTDLAENA